MELSPLLINLNSAIYSGCGNLFILTYLPELAAECIPLCQLNGTDGLILIEKSSLADLKLRIFNRDGSEAEMCGNGLRCAIQFFIDQFAPSQRVFSVETMHGVTKVAVQGEQIVVDFPLPESIEPILINGFCGYFLNTGVPHAVFFVNHLDEPFNHAPSIRHDPRFFPQGTNVNFALLGAPLVIRTYERGVEGETLSCGTGCVATALAAHRIHGLSSPISLLTRSQEVLTVAIHPGKATLSGPATLVSVDVYEKN